MMRGDREGGKDTVLLFFFFPSIEVLSPLPCFFILLFTPNGYQQLTRKFDPFPQLGNLVCNRNQYENQIH